MGRPRSEVCWSDRQRIRRLKQRLLALGAMARTMQVTLFLDGNRLLAINDDDSSVRKRDYRKQRIAYLEKTCELIGVYGPRADDAYSVMMEDCEAMGVFE